MCRLSFFKGMGAGMIVGACIGMAVAAEKKGCRRAISKAVKTAGSVIDSIGL